jgi:hypothetical protein
MWWNRILLAVGMGIAVVLGAIAGCTDAERAGISALGSAADITCYSGGVVTYHGKSTGKVSTTQGSDGWEFRDATTGRFVRVSGACVVLN